MPICQYPSTIRPPQVAKVPPDPAPLPPRDYLETGINMDKDRAFPQMGHRNVRVPSSPSSSEPEDYPIELIFDWPAYCNSFTEKPSSSQSLYVDEFIENIPSLIDNFPTRNLFNMGSPHGSADFSTPDYSSHPSPPELIRGDESSSPSDHSEHWQDQSDDASPRRQPSISLEDFRRHDDQWTYPQAEPLKATAQKYPAQNQVRSDSVVERRLPYQAAEPSLKKRRRSPDKRQRQLVDPLQTADVRRSGACVPCRLSKTRCFDNGSCPTCRKNFPDHAHLACTRLTPAQAWPVVCKAPDVWSKEPGLERELCRASHLWVGTPREISILFSRDATAPKLQTVAHAYGSGEGDDNFRKVSFHRDHVPSYTELQAWVEQVIQNEATSTFESALPQFLLAYTHEGVGLPRHRLVSNVHMMNCFFRIWKTSTFWCKDPSQRIVNLPVSMQATLRNIVRSGIHSVELDILKELEECLAQQGTLKLQERMAIWASMWQIILIYRDLKQEWSAWLSRMSRVLPAGEMEQYNQHYKAIDNFFPLITVFYHYQFRTKKSLEVSLAWLKTPFYPHRACYSKALQDAAKNLLDCRKSFCQSLQSSKDKTDELLCIIVVNHELKKLNARNRAPKLKNGTVDEYGDEDAD